MYICSFSFASFLNHMHFFVLCTHTWHNIHGTSALFYSLFSFRILSHLWFRLTLVLSLSLAHLHHFYDDLFLSKHFQYRYKLHTVVVCMCTFRLSSVCMCSHMSWFFFSYFLYACMWWMSIFRFSIAFLHRSTRCYTLIIRSDSFQLYSCHCNVTCFEVLLSCSSANKRECKPFISFHNG